MTAYLSEPSEWQGHFWPAGDQAQARPGVLSYTPDTGTRLNLIGGFNDAQWVPASGGGQMLTETTREWPVVHGISGRMPITLLRCASVHSTGPGFGFDPYEQGIHAEQALVGIHLLDESSALFTGIKIWLENLTVWAWDSDITVGMGRNKSNQRQWDIHVEQTESRFAHLDGFTAELSRGHLLIDGRRRGHLNVGTHEITSISFHSKRPRPLEDWLEMVGIAQDLISVAMDRPCAVLGQTLSPTGEAMDNSESRARSEIPVYTRGLIVGNPDEPAAGAHTATFTLNDARFDVALTRWIYVQRRFTTACNMLLGLQHMGRHFLETQLMTAVGAAEVFHRKLDRKPPIPAQEFTEMKARMLDCVPPERRQSMDNRLHNEHSLRERLIDLTAIPDSEIMSRLVPNPKKWATATVRARNGIAHRGKADVDEMYAVVAVTTAVVLANILHQLEIPKERLFWAVTDSETLSRGARLSAERWPAKNN